MHIKTFFIFAVMGWLLAIYTPSSLAGETSCYRSILKVQPPPTKVLNLVMVDATAPGAVAAVNGFRTIIASAALREGERFVAIPFAGLSASEVPRPVLDVINEPEMSPEATGQVTLAAGDRMRACLKRVRANTRAELDKVIRNSVQQPSKPAGSYSEIIYALREVLGSFATSEMPIRVFMYSDGAENSRGGISFYSKGVPRLINPIKEIERVSKLGWAVLPGEKRASGLSVLWFGLGATPTSSKVFLSPQQMEGLQGFWTRLLQGYGASRVQIGMVLNNPEI